MRVREAGDAAFMIEFDERIDPSVSLRVVAAADALRSQSLPGVYDVVPTYRSVVLHFDPVRTDRQRIRAALERAADAAVVVDGGSRLEIPVVYGGPGGPDLPGLAEWAGLEVGAVIERHVDVDYRVYMLGFLPGFAYLGSVDDRIAAPRHETPRVRVPSGSVGIAGRQTGVYPRESPGGWRIIGRTAMRLFDLSQTPPSLLRAGDTVRFRRASDVGPFERPPALRSPGEPPTQHGSRTVTVVRPGLFATVQDEGRRGHQASGVGVSGPLDRWSHRVANAAVGNGRDAATIEVTIAGPELRLDHDAVLAVAGADLRATLDGAAVRLGVPVACRAGSILRFGERQRGARAYVAFDGGIDVEPVLGSRSTHVSAGLGGLEGRPLKGGDRLPLGQVRRGRSRPIELPGSIPPREGKVRVLPGPQDDFFPQGAFERLESTRFQVTSRSDRMGYRLSGGALPRVAGREMISDATFTGAIQVPPSGEPILLMHDRQTTGGYPQIATVITADLPLAGQLAPGDWVEFRRCSMAEALAALDEQEAALDAL